MSYYVAELPLVLKDHYYPNSRRTSYTNELLDVLAGKMPDKQPIGAQYETPLLKVLALEAHYLDPEADSREVAAMSTFLHPDVVEVLWAEAEAREVKRLEPLIAFAKDSPTNRLDGDQNGLETAAALMMLFAHSGEKRATGDPYVIHTIGIAALVATSLIEDTDEKEIATVVALLHDGLETAIDNVHHQTPRPSFLQHQGVVTPLHIKLLLEAFDFGDKERNLQAMGAEMLWLMSKPIGIDGQVISSKTYRDAIHSSKTPVDIIKSSDDFYNIYNPKPEDSKRRIADSTKVELILKAIGRDTEHHLTMPGRFEVNRAEHEALKRFMRWLEKPAVKEFIDAYEIEIPDLSRRCDELEQHLGIYKIANPQDDQPGLGKVA